MVLLREEFREGIGLAIVRANDMLMFILTLGAFPKHLFCFRRASPHCDYVVLLDMIDSQEPLTQQGGGPTAIRWANAF